MKSVLLVVALIFSNPVLAKGHKKPAPVPVPSPVGQVFSFVNLRDYDDFDDISVSPKSDPVSIYLALTKEEIVLCYRPGRKNEALKFLEKLHARACGYMEVTDEENNISVGCGVNYSFTEFESSKTVPECSKELLDKLKAGLDLE